MMRNSYVFHRMSDLIFFQGTGEPNPPLPVLGQILRESLPGPGPVRR